MKHALFLSVAMAAFATACSTPQPPDAQPSTPSTPVATTMEDHQARGKYLVEIMGCGDCHSPKRMGANGPYPDPDRLFSGHPANETLPHVDPAVLQNWSLMNMGNTACVGPWGISFAANISSDQTGIGAWSEEQFERAVRHGKWKGLEGSRELLPPMPWQAYASLTNEDVSAIYAYLISTAPVENLVPAPIPPDALP